MAQGDLWHLCPTRMQVWVLARHSGLKDLAFLQLQCRLQLWLGSDPWPRNSICRGMTKKKKKKKRRSPFYDFNRFQGLKLQSGHNGLTWWLFTVTGISAGRLDCWRLIMKRVLDSHLWLKSLGWQKIRATDQSTHWWPLMWCGFLRAWWSQVVRLLKMVTRLQAQVVLWTQKKLYHCHDPAL